MTIRLLTPRGVWPANAIVTLDAATEAALVADGVASTSLAGGTPYAPVDTTDRSVEARMNPTTGALVAGLRRWNTSSFPGLGRYSVDDVMPRHRPIMVPSLLNVGAIVTGSGSVSVSLDTTDTANEFYSQSLLIDVTGAVGSDVTFRIPLPVDQLGVGARIGTKLHTRIKVSDWSAVTRFYISPAEQAGTSHRYIFPIAELSGVTGEQGQVSSFGAARWNNTWRTVMHEGYRKSTVGSPQPWANDGSATVYYDTDGIVVTLRTTGAVQIRINRIYSPVWPVGALIVVGDGCYKSFQDLVVGAFNQRGWKCGVSAFKVSGAAPYATPGFRDLPTLDQLSSVAAQGHDVAPHISMLSLVQHNEAALLNAGGASVPATDVQTHTALVSHINRLTRSAIGRTPGLRYGQCLQNAGRTNTVDTASLFKQHGIEFGRGPLGDGIAGFDPWHASVSSAASWRNSEAGRDKTKMAGWIPERGMHNGGYEQAWFANDTTDNEPTRLLRDTYAGSAMQTALLRAASHGSLVRSYTHHILPYGSQDINGTAALEPTVFNSGVNFWNDMLADIDTKFAADQLVVISPSQHQALTYEREGDLYVRWDGEWVNRQTGRIAI